MFGWLKRLFTESPVTAPKEGAVKEVPLNSLAGYTCNECHAYITREELNGTWDWGGPHCPHCGNTGMNMLANVIEQEAPKGIRSARKGS